MIRKYRPLIIFVCCFGALALPGCTSFTSSDLGNHQDVVSDLPTDTNVRDVHNDAVDADLDAIDRDLADQSDEKVPDLVINDEGVVVPDVLPDVNDVQVPDVVETFDPDAPCVPNCQDRECGPSGCPEFGDCGYCQYGFQCEMASGTCVEQCIPDCLKEGKACGNDGCTGNCGDCGVNFKCGIDFQCHPDVCEPDCVKMGKECGEDNCGGSCGLCGDSQVCSVGGICAAGACFGVDKERNTCSLDRKYLYICTETGTTESLLKIDCTVKTGPECGTRGCECNYNVWSGTNDCIEKPPCVPDCEGKECGDDGCGGSCATCTGGWACTSAFTCRPFAGAECVYIGWIGTCWDGWVYWCSSDEMGQGEILAENCPGMTPPKICAYSPAGGQYVCQ